MTFKEAFQDELAYIKQLAEEFGNDFPHLENIFSNSQADPDIAQLFESFAFLTAKSRQKIEDAFPEITHNLLERLFPLPLRPLPSSLIFHVKSRSGEVVTLKKDTYLRAPINKVIFSTVRDIAVLPLAVTYVATEQAPEGTVLTLTLHYSGKMDGNGFITNYPLSFFLGENSRLAAQLQLWFSQYLMKAQIVIEKGIYSVASLCAPNVVFAQNPFKPVLPTGAPQYAGLQLVSEFISLPHMHDFLSLDFCGEYSHIPCNDDGSFQLRFHFNRALLSDETLTPAQFQLNCVPALNVFEQCIPSQQLSGKRHKIMLADKWQFYALSAVFSQHRDNEDDDAQAEENHYLPITQFLPQHWTDNSLAKYFQIKRTKNRLEQIESAVIFLNAKGEIVEPPYDHYFTYRLLCTHCLDVDQIKKGSQCSGEESIPNHLVFETVTQNSAGKSPNIDAKNHWQLISHLSLSPAFLSDVDVIRELLADLDFYDSEHYAVHSAWLRKLNSLQKTDVTLLDWLFNGQLKRGMQIKLFLSPEYFDSVGELYQFGCLIAQILPFCIVQSAFLKVDIINVQTQETWSLSPVLGARHEI